MITATTYMVLAHGSEYMSCKSQVDKDGVNVNRSDRSHSTLIELDVQALEKRSASHRLAIRGFPFSVTKRCYCKGWNRGGTKHSNRKETPIRAIQRRFLVVNNCVDRGVQEWQNKDRNILQAEGIKREFSRGYVPSNMFIPSTWVGAGVYLLGPSQLKGLHRSLKTGSNRIRSPLGNST